MEAFPFRPISRLTSASSESGVCWLERHGYFAVGKNDRVELIPDITDASNEGGGDPPPLVDEEEGEQLNLKYNDVIDLAGKSDPIVIASLHRTGLVKVWKQDNDQQPSSLSVVLSWQFGSSPAKFVQIDPSGRWVTVGAVSGKLRVFDVTDGSCTHHFAHLLEAGDTLSCLRFHPTKLLLFAGSNSGHVIVMDLVRSCILFSVRGHNSAVTDAAFVGAATAAGEAVLLVTVGRDKWIQLWSLEDMGIQLGKRVIGRDAMIPFGEAQLPGEIKSEKKRRRKDGHGNEEGFAEAHAACDFKMMPTAQMRVDEEIESLAILSRKMSELTKSLSASWFVLTGGEKSRVRLWDLLSLKEVTEPESMLEGFVCPRIPAKRIFRSANGLRLAVLGVDKSITIWETSPTVRPTISLRGANTPWESSVVSCRGQGLQGAAIYFTTGILDRLQRVEMTVDGKPSTVTELHITESARVSSFDVSGDGNHVVVVDVNMAIRVIDTESGAVKQTTPAQSAGTITKVKCSAVRSTGQPFFITISTDKFARVWPISSTHEVLATPVSRTQVSDREVFVTAISPNNKWLFTAGADKKIKLWNLPDLSSAGVCSGHRQAVISLAVSPIEQIFVSASLDLSVKVWSISTLQPLATLSGAEECVRSLVYHPDGIHLLGACSDGRLHFWDTKKGIAVGCAQRHHAPLQQVAVLRIDTGGNSRNIAVTTSEDGGVVLWDDLSAVRAEEAVAAELRLREDLGAARLLVARGMFDDAIKLALKWRRYDLFEECVRSVQRHVSNLPEEDAATTADTILVNLDEASLEQCLMAALHFTKHPSTVHLAQWIAGLLLKNTRTDELRKVKGFVEFAGAFSTKAQQHTLRLERLREKSFLVDLVILRQNALLTPPSHQVF